MRERRRDRRVKAAYITGASNGLGRRIAELLAGKFRLGLGCHSQAAPDLPAALALPGDIADPATSERAVETLLDRFGRLDLFIANAAITADRPFLKMTDEEWERTIAVNLSGVFYGLRACEDALRRSRGMAILIASVMGRRGAAGAANYAASKAGVLALMRTAAREWAPEARVNAVIPGYMPTAMGLAAPAALEAARAEHILDVLTPVEDAARLVVAVAELETVSGQVFTADGRLSRW
jgi:3-oxoacyl-[acyl-carrier protein] reductase